MENLIELLKKNMVPIGLWPKFYGEVVGKAMQAKMKQMEPKDIECFLTTGPAEWGSCENFSWTNMERHISNTYRLRSDYEEKPEEPEEPEIVEWEIKPQPCYADLLGFATPFTDQYTATLLSDACKFPTFIGFKFDDDLVSPCPILYKWYNEPTPHIHYSKLAGRLDDCTILHATHVLFRRPK